MANSKRPTGPERRHDAAEGARADQDAWNAKSRATEGFEVEANRPRMIKTFSEPKVTRGAVGGGRTQGGFGRGR